VSTEAVRPGSIEWAGEQLGLSPRSVKRLLRERRLGYIALTPGGWKKRITEQHIQDYLAANDRRVLPATKFQAVSYPRKTY
jgi:hypothetical protein